MGLLKSSLEEIMNAVVWRCSRGDFVNTGQEESLKYIYLKEKKVTLKRIIELKILSIWRELMINYFT